VCRSEDYGDTVVTFLERADTCILDVTAEIIIGFPAASLSRNSRSDMSLPICFGGMGLGDSAALADAAHVGATGMAVDFVVRFLTTQGARVRKDAHDDVPMEPTIDGRLATAMNTAVSRRPSAPDGDGGDNEPVLSLHVASS
jgi:hypothetical protein